MGARASQVSKYAQQQQNSGQSGFYLFYYNPDIEEVRE